MKLITRYDLQTLSLAELQALYRKLYQKLSQSFKGSAARRNCLASLENIEREIHVRMVTDQPPSTSPHSPNQKPGF